MKWEIICLTRGWGWLNWAKSHAAKEMKDEFKVPHTGFELTTRNQSEAIRLATRPTGHSESRMGHEYVFPCSNKNYNKTTETQISIYNHILQPFQTTLIIRPLIIFFLRVALERTLPLRAGVLNPALLGEGNNLCFSAVTLSYISCNLERSHSYGQSGSLSKQILLETRFCTNLSQYVNKLW